MGPVRKWQNFHPCQRRPVLRHERSGFDDATRVQSTLGDALDSLHAAGRPDQSLPGIPEPIPLPHRSAASAAGAAADADFYRPRFSRPYGLLLDVLHTTADPVE